MKFEVVWTDTRNGDTHYSIIDAKNSNEAQRYIARNRKTVGEIIGSSRIDNRTL